MSSLGNTGVSSLLTSAASSARTLANLNDEQQAFNFQYGPQDEAAFNSYQNYLNGRIKTLQQSSSPTDASKLITLSRNLIDAQRTYNTNQVQNVTLGIMNGQYNESDKLGLLGNQLQQAINSGADPQTIQGLQTLYSNQALKVTNQGIASANAETAAGKAAQDKVNKAYTDHEAVLQNGAGGIKETQALFQSGHINALQYAERMTPLYTALNNIYQIATSDGRISSDQQNAFNGKLSDLNKNGEYNLLANPTVQQKLNAGEDVFNVKTDSITGQKSLATNKVIGQQVAKDAQGNPYIQDKFDLSKSAKAFNTEMTSNGSATILVPKPGGTEQQTVFKDPNTGAFYYIDSTTGAKVQYDPATGRHLVYDPNNPNVNPIEQQKQALGQDKVAGALNDIVPQLGDVVNSGLKTDAKFIKDNIGKVGSATASTVKGAALRTIGSLPVIGPVASAVTSLFNTAQQGQQQHAAATKAAFDALVASTANLPATRANSAVQTGGTGGAPRININPTPAQAAQSAAAAVPAANKPTAAINAATGFLPYLTGLPSNYAAIIGAGTNYGGTVQSLRNAGVTQDQLATGGALDTALRAANSAGQFH